MRAKIIVDILTEDAIKILKLKEQIESVSNEYLEGTDKYKVKMEYVSDR